MAHVLLKGQYSGAAAAQNLSEETMRQEIIAVMDVVQAYFDMLYTADCAAAERIFFPEAHVQSLSKDTVVSIDLEGFKKRMLGRPVPRDRREARDGAILSLDFAGPSCAHVKLRSTMLDTFFIDYLTLLKNRGQWRIISKVFHAESVA